jgi:hypothetical protein
VLISKLDTLLCFATGIHTSDLVSKLLLQSTASTQWQAHGDGGLLSVHVACRWVRLPPVHVGRPTGMCKMQVRAITDCASWQAHGHGDLLGIHIARRWGRTWVRTCLCHSGRWVRTCLCHNGRWQLITVAGGRWIRTCLCRSGRPAGNCGSSHRYRDASRYFCFCAVP